MWLNGSDVTLRLTLFLQRDADIVKWNTFFNLPHNIENFQLLNQFCTQVSDTYMYMYIEINVFHYIRKMKSYQN